MGRQKALTGVDELLGRSIPSFLFANSFLHLRNLVDGRVSNFCCFSFLIQIRQGESIITVSAGSASMTNFCCLRSCKRKGVVSCMGGAMRQISILQNSGACMKGGATYLKSELHREEKPLKTE